MNQNPEQVKAAVSEKPLRMSADEVQKSQWLQGNPPEIFSTPLLKIRENEWMNVEDELANDPNRNVAFNFNEDSLVASERSGKANSSSRASMTFSEAALLKIFAEIESKQWLLKAEDDLVLAPRTSEIEMMIAEKRLHMEMLQTADE
ncbi:unnamed protein product [Allacma fusca]|uniref:Uncharacterized protein n=1 Tax=Allacma fusca TaxID=39272 RepID=A0A8J2JRC4_9HEXA|nr:unnamed protein product [Allacma fusca]